MFARFEPPGTSRAEHEGYYMRPLILAPTILLAGCNQLTSTFDEPEVQACEHFLKETLGSPASYDRVEVIIRHESISAKELDEITVNPPLLANKDPGLLFVSIEYDAKNGYGSVTRASQLCAFETDGGEFPPGGEAVLMSEARMAASATALRDLVASGAVDGTSLSDLGPSRKYPCCLR